MIPTYRLRYVKILEFTHFVTFFSFNKIGENHKEKILVKKVTVVVALDLGTGNRRNLIQKKWGVMRKRWRMRLSDRR